MITRLLLLCAGLFLALPASAQDAKNPFSPAIRVNASLITHFELAQREAFLRVLNTPGDLADQARDGLIDERLQMQEARRFNVVANQDDVSQAMEEFAGRADLTAEEFIGRLEEVGIARQTFENFMLARISWRNVVQGMFGPRSRPSDAEVDRAMAMAGERGGAEVKLSEIVLPLTPEQAEGNRLLMERLAETITSGAEFADAARSYSVSPTSRQGGEMGWVPISRLPPQISSMMLTMEPGDITDPVPVQNAIAIFRLGGFRETGTARPRTQSAEYLRVLLPGGDTEENRKRARALQARLDRCDDFYAVAGQYPKDLVVREAVPRDQIPAGILEELERLDPNQARVTPVSAEGGAALQFLMLCARTTEQAEIEGGRDEFRLRLFSSRIDSYARSHLAQLRANAVIEDL